MDKQAEIARIKAEYEARNKEIERQHRLEMAKIIGGGLLSIGSAFIPGTAGLKVAGALGKTIAPMVGKKIGTEIASGLVSGGLSGAVEGLGRGLIENKNPLKTMAQDSSIGLATGGLGGYALGKTARTIDKFNNPWFVDDVVQNDKNVVQYKYDKINPKNSSTLSNTGTPKVIQKIRMEGSGHNGGAGVYSKRSYTNANNGVVATYYPTKNLTKNAKVKGWETPKFNELTPNDDKTAQLYYDTLSGVKKQFGKTYDTVSLYPVEEYKNMRLFISPDKANGFAIKPDGDIVSVFGSKPGSGTSHSMLELALQKEGTKLDNYDVSRLRNLYDSHGFEVTERYPWSDEYWNPKEWDKEAMKKIYGNAEPDITYRQIKDKNIYPKTDKTKFIEQLLDALK